nr:nucleotide-binding alpha-beta plait domain-containing protein [Tanacetum cinerariifolium]
MLCSCVVSCIHNDTDHYHLVSELLEDEPRFNEDEVDIDEGERLFLEQALRWIPEGVPMALNDGSIFTFDDIERNEGEKGLVEGYGPTVVTSGPVASM